jgi:hypothetical protein
MLCDSWKWKNAAEAPKCPPNRDKERQQGQRDARAMVNRSVGRKRCD